MHGLKKIFESDIQKRILMPDTPEIHIQIDHLLDQAKQFGISINRQIRIDAERKIN